MIVKFISFVFVFVFVFVLFLFCFCFVLYFFPSNWTKSFLFSLFSFSSHQGLWGVLIDKDFKTTYYYCCYSNIQDVGLDWKGFQYTLLLRCKELLWSVVVACKSVCVLNCINIKRDCLSNISVSQRNHWSPPPLSHCYMKGLFSFILFLFFLPLSPSFLLTLIFSLFSFSRVLSLSL